MAAAGYSGTPLAKKLGLKPGMRAWFKDVPDRVRAEIERDAPPLNMLDLPEPPVEFAHIFVTSTASWTVSFECSCPCSTRRD